MIYVWAFLLMISNVVAWGTNLFNLPGNWFVLLLAVAYALMLPDAQPGLSWTMIGIAFALAVLGEVVEFAAGAAGAAKRGGARRGILLAIVGAFAGSLAGAFLGLPVPVVGPLVGAVGGGAVGAFLGAYGGELWAGRRPHRDRMEIGKGAFLGRLWGTAGKMLLGGLMVVIIVVDSFVDLR